MKTKKKKGFTLTELIVVIVIIGVLAAVMIPTLSGYITKAKNSKDETLVASLNKSYQNAKIMDDLEFYTAYDVDAFLKEVEMDNIEVANKNSLILFDADDEKFVLVKDIEKETKVNEFVYHISEYYSYKALKAEPISNKNSNAVLKPLASKKLGDEEESSTYEFHRAFIISINGNEISEAVATFMKINGETTQEELNEMKSVFTKTYSDSKFKENLSNAISKTLFIGKTKSFYIDSNYQIKEFTGTNPSGQSLKRVAILGDVEELDLSKISNLNNSTIIIPNTVSNVIIPDTLESSIQLSGNVDKDNEHYIDLNSALILPLAKELLDVNPNVKNENELNDVLKSYDSESIIKTIVKKTGLSESNSMITNLKTNLDKINKTIVICDSFSITKNTTIPKGVTVIVPFNTKGEYIGYTDEQSQPIAKIYVGENEDLYGSYRKINLTIEVGKKLEVKGSIIVGGTVNTWQPLISHTSGAYGQITNNGVVNLYGSSEINENGETINYGTLDVYGYIIGEGKIVSTAGTITQLLSIGDYGGGSNASALYAFGLSSSSPFTQYCLANIWCQVELDSNSLYKGRGFVYGNDQRNEISPVCIIGNSDKTLIKLATNANATIHYKADEQVDGQDRTKMTAFGKMHIDIKGGADTGNLSIKLEGNEFSTSKFTLPIPYSFSFKFSSKEGESNVYNINTKIALLPGSEMIVDENTKLIVSKDATLSVFEKLDNYSLTLNNSEIHKYPENLQAAKLLIKGELEVKGGIGGKVIGENNSKITIGTDAKGVYKSESKRKETYEVKFGAILVGNREEYTQTCSLATDETNTIIPERSKTYICDENGYWKVSN